LTPFNDEIIAEMKANRLLSMRVFLYGMKPEIHGSITKLPGSFIKTRGDIVRGVCVSSIRMAANGNVYPRAGWQGYVVGNGYEQSRGTSGTSHPR
jgi:MoaA/NifB/PqqE/SkfB family radical SAM enzyme